MKGNPGTSNSRARESRLAVLAALAFVVLVVGPAVAQTAPTAEEARQLEFGKEIFKSKAVCQFCHKWDVSGPTSAATVTLATRWATICRRRAMISCRNAKWMPS